MTISNNAAVFQYGDQSTVISDSTSINNGSFNAGTITPLTLVDNVPFADLSLDITFASNPAANAVINVYRRDLNIDGANSTPVPDNQFKQLFVGRFVPDIVSTRQYLFLPNVALSPDQEFYIENLAGVATTGTTILKAKPKTYNGRTV